MRSAARALPIPLGRADNVRLGIFYMLASVFLFAMQNAVVKWLAERYPIAEMVFFRSAFSLFPAGLLLWRAGGWRLLRTKRPFAHLLRSALWGGSLCAAFLSYHLLPLANAISLSFAAPLFMTALSVPLLKEPVGKHRWAAVLVGFVGVLVMARPSAAGGDPIGIACGIGTAFFGAVGSLAVRSLSRTESSAAVVFYMGVFIAVLALPPLPFIWVRPADLLDLVALCSLGLVGGIGQYWTTQALFHAPAAAVAPFSYTALIWGSLLGFVFWDEIPTLALLFGAAIVTLSGLYILHREALHRTAPPPPPSRGDEPELS